MLKVRVHSHVGCFLKPGQETSDCMTSALLSQPGKLLDCPLTALPFFFKKKKNLYGHRLIRHQLSIGGKVRSDGAFLLIFVFYF